MEREKLQQYRQLCREIEELEEEKQALAEGRLPSSWPLGGISGKGAPGDPTGRTAAKLWDLAVLLANKLNELIALRTEIEQAVEGLPPEERRILRLYYIDGLTWEAVAEEVGYSVRQLSRKQKSIMERFCPERETAQGELAQNIVKC
jgi:RNA polymerase sigma factor (sigma-70 family)